MRDKVCSHRSPTLIINVFQLGKPSSSKTA